MTFQEPANSEEWVETMGNEMTFFKENATWILQQLPFGKKAIPCKQVYQVKIHVDGFIDKSKTRLVFKGYSQRKGAE